jgi:hypothetical protein
MQIQKDPQDDVQLRLRRQRFGKFRRQEFFRLFFLLFIELLVL